MNRNLISGNKKLFLAILILLVVIVIAEFVYYNFFLSNTTRLKPISSSSPTTQNSKNAPSQNTAIDWYVLGYLRTFSKDLVNKSTISTEFEGEILRLDTKQGTMPGTYFKYNLVVSIKGKNQRVATFYYNENNLKNLKVFKKAGASNQTIKLEDLKVGDKILIQETMDPTKDFSDNRTEILFIKI